MSRRVRGPVKKEESWWDSLGISSVLAMCGGRMCEGDRSTTNPSKNRENTTEEDKESEKPATKVRVSRAPRQSVKRRPDSDEEVESINNNVKPEKSASPGKRLSSAQANLSDLDLLKEKLRQQYQILDQSCEGWLYQLNSFGIGRKSRWVSVWRSALLYSEKTGSSILGGADLSRGSWDVKLSSSNRFVLSGETATMEFEVSGSKGKSSSQEASAEDWVAAIESQLEAIRLLNIFLKGAVAKGIIKANEQSSIVNEVSQPQAIEKFKVSADVLK
eukprot:GDKJ01032399.1.p1 GENE.GDKJ01032399.1~~GDKJ01032399.1.p1  ORF type:complete len:274 (+),score=53.56 GDKJ01032399.1:12-833(+)